MIIRLKKIFRSIVGNFDLAAGISACFVIGVLNLLGVVKIDAVFNGILWVLIILILINARNRKYFNDSVERINDQNLAYVLGGMLPNVVFEHIRDFLVRSPFIRKEYSVYITFKQLDNDYVEIEFVESYKVENISKNIGTYQIQGAIDKEFGLELDKNKFTELKIARKNGVETLNEEDLSKEGFVKDKGSEVKLHKEIIIDGLETIDIATQRTKVQRSNDSNYWKSPQICDSLNIIVSHPENIEVLATAFHPSQASFRVKHQNKTHKNWMISESILPYQGVHLSWKQI